MNPQTDPPLAIKNRIARRRERIAKWDKEADEVETSWTGGPESPCPVSRDRHGPRPSF